MRGRSNWVIEEFPTRTHAHIHRRNRTPLSFLLSPLFPPRCILHAGLSNSTAAAAVRRRKHTALVLSLKQIPIAAGGGSKEIEGCIGGSLFSGIGVSRERRGGEGTNSRAHRSLDDRVNGTFSFTYFRCCIIPSAAKTTSK